MLAVKPVDRAAARQRVSQVADAVRDDKNTPRLPAARLDRMIGYYEPYASSHAALDGDTDVQEEVRQVARAVITAVTAIRGGLLAPADSNLVGPRVK